MTEPAPTLSDSDAEAVLDASASLLGLTVEPAWRVGVLLNLKATAAAAALVLDFPLDDELEPAPVFRA